MSSRELVLKFYGEVFNALNAGAAAKYLREDYIQHNPTVKGGRGGFIETFREAFVRFMEYVHRHTDARLVREYFWRSGETINWLEDMGVPFHGAKRYSPVAEETWHVVQPEDGSLPAPRAAEYIRQLE